MRSENQPLAPGISVVVPVFNSAPTLAELVTRLNAVLSPRPEPFEVLLVNDGSGDNSWDTISQISSAFGFVRGINLMRNYGQHNALLCGIRAATYNVTVILDDDLQQPPEEIPKLLECLAQGNDVVYGAPDQNPHGLWRDTAARITKLALQSALGAQTARKVSPFRAFRTELRDAFSSYRSPFVSIDVLLTWATTSFSVVPVRYSQRQVGRSQYTFRQLVTHALNMMTGFSIFPLQLATLIGFGSTLFGLAVLVFVLGRYLIHGVDVPGFTFLASIVAVFSGAQLFAIGIFGEYLARIHFRMMERPPYVVRSSTSQGPRESTP